MKKPDLDNLLKAVMDALTAAGAWKDDAQVRSIKASKHYACGLAAGADVLILEDGQ
ncbi:MAG: RusA family crossover junction endodeoxyribonuclease [Treponema sp.]|nr:RusA family crossover junction endodeoxyribonuclease [Treponema sp.]